MGFLALLAAVRWSVNATVAFHELDSIVGRQSADDTNPKRGRTAQGAPHRHGGQLELVIVRNSRLSTSKV